MKARGERKQTHVDREILFSHEEFMTSDFAVIGYFEDMKK